MYQYSRGDHSLQSEFDTTTVVYIGASSVNSQRVAAISQKANYGYIHIPDSLRALSELIQLKPRLIFRRLRNNKVPKQGGQ